VRFRDPDVAGQIVSRIDESDDCVVLLNRIHVAEMPLRLKSTTQKVAGSTTLVPYPTDIYAANDHLTALAERYAKVGGCGAGRDRRNRQCRRRRHGGSLHSLLASPRQALWFLEAHLQ
jgi:hypothetical protein